MRLNRPAALLLALFTTGPFLVMGLFFLYIIAAMLAIGLGRDGHGLPWLGIVMPILMACLLATLLLMVAYVILIIANPRLTNESKFLWLAALVIGSIFTMPAYWWVQIWKPLKEEEEERARGGATRSLRTL